VKCPPPSSISWPRVMHMAASRSGSAASRFGSISRSRLAMMVNEAPTLFNSRPRSFAVSVNADAAAATCCQGPTTSRWVLQAMASARDGRTVDFLRGVHRSAGRSPAADEPLVPQLQHEEAEHLLGVAVAAPVRMQQPRQLVV
jgi:hypothetical protein